MTAFHGIATVLAGLVGVSAIDPGIALRRWGEHGHQLVAQAAAAQLPATMPVFFRYAAPQFMYLNPEPDRWRDRGESNADPAMNGAHSPEHYIDFEWTTASSFSAPNRFAFLDSVQAAGIKENPGLLPYRILELTQRLRVNFRLWRAATDPEQRSYIEARIVNDAGILGHYVADGANPHHTTIHHNGWVGANPKGYATDKEFHSRFESRYVQRTLKIADVTTAMKTPPTLRAPARDSIMSYLRRSHAQLERLYELDKAARFDSTTTAEANKQFAAERLAAGAEMLRDLWWTAWETSATVSDARRGAPPE